jgi:Tfp pilus assembly protein PilV
MKTERGTALLEVVILGFAVLALALPTFATIASLSDAHARVNVAATDAATWLARHGTMPPDTDAEVEVTASVFDGVVTVRAVASVSMLGVEFTTVSAQVTGSRIAGVSPYRSGR